MNPWRRETDSSYEHDNMLLEHSGVAPERSFVVEDNNCPANIPSPQAVCESTVTQDPVDGFENAYIAENRLSSNNQDEVAVFATRLMMMAMAPSPVTLAAVPKLSMAM